MSRFLPLCAVLIACGGPLPEVQDGSGSECLAHEVEIEVEDGVARMMVRRTLRTFDPTLSLSIVLPSGGSVDRFAFAVDGRWYPADLVDADWAEERFDLLSGLAGRDDLTTEGALPPALLAWETEGELSLEAHPVPPGSIVEIRYRITAPTCHLKGRPVLDYPYDPSDAPVILGSGDVREGDGDWADACDEDATLLQGERLILGLSPLAVGEVRATRAVQPLGDGRSAIRIAVDAPPELAPLPREARVVFVVDASISQGDERLQDQLAWAAAYLDWLPDASVEVVRFDRFAEPLFGRFVPAEDFTDAVQALPPDRLLPMNGSHADRGIALAAELGPDRIVVTSDLLLRSSFDPEAVAVPVGTVLHMLNRTPQEGWPRISVDRDEGGVFSIAARTGGLGGRLNGDPWHEEAVAVAEELVRPIRIDDVALEGGEELLDNLPRGETIRTLWIEEEAPEVRAVTGRLWSRPVRFDVVRSSALDEAMPAILIGTRQVSILDEEVVRDLAELGGVVSPYTSYLAEMGGAEPATEPEQVGCIGGFGFGIGSRTTCGCCGGVAVSVSNERQTEWLRAKVQELRTACAFFEPVALETTRDEIVDVIAEDECVRENLWDVRLPQMFRSLFGNRTFRFD